MVNNRQEEVSPDYEKKATKLDSHVPGDDVTPFFQDKLKTFGINGRVLGPTVGAWCEVSEDFDLILDLIAHALADEETSTIQVPHHQSVARQKSKLVADFGLMMHLTWARQLLDTECTRAANQVQRPKVRTGAEFQNSLPQCVRLVDKTKRGKREVVNLVLYVVQFI